MSVMRKTYTKVSFLNYATGKLKMQNTICLLERLWEKKSLACAVGVNKIGTTPIGKKIAFFVFVFFSPCAYGMQKWIKHLAQQ